MSIESSVSGHYRSDAGARYVAHHQANPHNPGYEIDAAYFIPRLKASDKVLDFGCGNGGIANCIRPYVTRIDGVEVNPHAAAIAREIGIEVYGSMDDIPDGSRYDVIISNHVLEHVRDPLDELQACGQRLAASGRLILKLPLDDWRQSRQKTWQTEDIDRHLYTWTPRLLSNLLDEAGFKANDVQIVTSAWHPKLFLLERFRLGRAARWLLAAVKRRRQLIAEAKLKPS